MTDHYDPESRRLAVQGSVSVQHFRQNLPAVLLELADQLLDFAEQEGKCVKPATFRAELVDKPRYPAYLLRLTIDATDHRTPKK